MNAKTKKGYTAFTGACISGHTDVVKLLLDQSDIKNIDLNAKNEKGWTGFTVACIIGHTNIVKLLLDNSDVKNINLYVKDNDLQSLAYKHEHSDVVNLLAKFIGKDGLDTTSITIQSNDKSQK